MEWQKMLEGILGSSPVAGVLGFVAWKLWTKNEKKDEEIARLNEQHSKTLIAISKLSDER